MADRIYLNSTDDATAVFDRHFTLVCPHCGVLANLTAVSVPRYAFATRFKPSRLGVVYRCDSCNAPVVLIFPVEYEPQNARLTLLTNYQEIQRPKGTFAFEYLSNEVANDYREALACYSSSCFNAFAAMCRRTVQSVCADLGATGKDKVLSQLKDLKEMAQIDDELFELLKQVVIDGHDGAHPHLPSLSPGRAAVLLELMNDVLYQLYVRRGKLNEAAALRKQARGSGS